MNKNKKKIKIAIIGSEGYVGRAVKRLLKNHYQIIPYDIIGVGSWEEVNKCQLAIICVPTPMKKDGSCDISIVEKTVSRLQVPIILIKSTIPPGTTKKLKKKYKKRIVFSPEYIGEGNYFIPFWKGYPHPTKIKYHNFQIFGGDRKDTNVWVEIFQRVLGPDCRYIQTDSTTAELTKYMENSWGATKVTFCNEFYRIAKIFGVDYRELRELFLLDGRTERMHTSVFEGNYGFGGKCFPKDVNAIVKASKKAGYKPKFLEEVLRSNKRFRKDNRK